ncbi:CUB and sushi domain-containing protein 3-like [Mytilus trossulus]|uniref:CUB and sushi domain-containing protein 3-like n=1 Tax=Mytilus trossulus TaxID=6551 RepID=UPI0030043D8C
MCQILDINAGACFDRQHTALIFNAQMEVGKRGEICHKKLISFIICLMYSSMSDAACTLPEDLRSSTWEYNYTDVSNTQQSKSLVISTTTLQNSVISLDGRGTTLDDWTCINNLNISSTEGVVVFKSDSTFSDGPSTNYRLYLCMKFTKVTPDLYYFYLLSDIYADVTPNERTFATSDSPANDAPICSTFCKYTVDTPKIRTLRRPGTMDTLPSSTSLCACGSSCKDDRCEPNPCQNNGTCVDLTDSFNCTCAPGWEDDNCTTAVTCDYPNTVPHTTNVTSGNEQDDTITLSCSVGYNKNSGDEVLTCKDDGEWDGSPIICSPVTCPNPSTPVSATKLVQTGSNYLDTITYKCNTGYELSSGNLVRTCKEGKLWDGIPPVCTKVTCQNPSAASFASLETQTGSKYLDTRIYKCNTGYELASGNLVRKCKEDKQWDGNPPVCTKVTCQNPSAASFASLETQTGSKYLDTRIYKCNTGYELASGNLVRKCKEDKLWDGSPPVCTKVTCQNPSAASFASLETQTGSKYLDTLTYKCYTGYELASGNLVRKCKENKLWDGNPPVCTKVTCQNTWLVAFSTVSTTGNQYQDTVTYTCNTGYELTSGNLVRTCMENKNWSGNQPVCTITCPDPGESDHVTRQLNGNNPTETVVYKCDSGYDYFSGNTTRVCGSDGQWSGKKLVCRAYLAVSNEQSNYIIAATISGLLLILAIIVIFLFCYFIVRKKKN